MNTDTENIMSPVVVDVREGWTSASNAREDRLCPARHLAQAAIPELERLEKPDKDRDAGRMLHNALLKRNPDGLPVDLKDRYDQACLLEDRLVSEYFGKDAEAARKNVIREQRFWVQVKVTRGGESKLLRHSGQPDVVYRHAARALIIEYKGLYGEIPPPADNEQLRDQAILVKGRFVVINEVAVSVIQPAVSHSPELCRYNKAALDESAKLLFKRVADSNDPQSPRVAGEVQCRFCRAKRECLQYNQFAGALVPGMMALLDVAANNWSPQQRSQFLDRFSVAQQWLDDRKDEIKALLQKDPDAAPGYGLRPGAIRETIAKPEVVFGRFHALGGTAEQYMECVAVTKAKLRAKVQEVSGAKGKGLDQAMDKLTEGCTVSSQSAPSIVRLKD